MRHMPAFIRPAESKSGWLVVAAALFLFIAACAPAKTDQEMQKEVQALKAEVTALKEKVSQLETNHKQIAENLKNLQKPEEVAAPAPSPSLMPPAKAPESLSIAQLFKEKDRLMGTRVRVKGTPGPVLMHKKIMYLQAPEGLVEVFFGNLKDKKQIERLSAQAMEQPLTVTGMLAFSPGAGKDPSRIQIMAEAVEF
jgi:hypothetical protein